MKKTFKVTDIIYDTDGQSVELPETLIVKAEESIDIADAISDITGYLVESFTFKELKDMKASRKEIFDYKNALAYCIEKTFDDKGIGEIIFNPSDYSSRKDMVHFTFDGHKCTLLGVFAVSVNDGILGCVLDTEDEGVVNLNLNYQYFNEKTLDRIANEVYDYVRPIEWADWESARKCWVANWLDSMVY